MFEMSEKDKDEGVMKIMNAIGYGGGTQVNEPDAVSRKPRRTRPLYPTIPAKRSIVIDLDSINSQGDLDRMLKRG